MDPYLVEIAQRLPDMTDRREIEDALDKLEFLFEVLDPVQQDQAGELIGRLNERLRGMAGAADA